MMTKNPHWILQILSKYHTRFIPPKFKTKIINKSKLQGNLIRSYNVNNKITLFVV